MNKKIKARNVSVKKLIVNKVLGEGWVRAKWVIPFHRVYLHFITSPNK
ncbi:hypothetical protein [Bacillus fonticola]|nr:hypothetical protein [Bacillus fonticola]